jgi:tetratricopeptide (TPR) repeat protein
VHPEVARSISTIGWVHQELGDLKSALEWHERALAMYQQIYGEVHPEVASSISAIGWVHQELGDLKSALETGRRALEMQLGLFGEVHRDVARSRLRVARALLADGQREAGRAELEACIGARGEVIANQSDEVRAARTWYAEVLLEDGDAARARVAAEQALAELDPRRDREAVERAERVLTA